MRYSMHWSMVTAFNQCMCLVKSWHSGTDYYISLSEFTYMKRNCIACNLSTCMYVCICMFMSRTVQWLPTKIAFWLNSYNIPTYLFMGRFFFMPDYDMDFTCGKSEWVLSVVPFISQLLYCGVMKTILTYLLTCLLAYLLTFLLTYVLTYLLTCWLWYFTVVGKTIKLPQLDSPSKEEVDKYHAIFLKVLRQHTCYSKLHFITRCPFFVTVLCIFMCIYICTFVTSYYIYANVLCPGIWRPIWKKQRKICCQNHSREQ